MSRVTVYGLAMEMRQVGELEPVATMELNGWLGTTITQTAIQPPTAVDRQLGLGYGAGAVRALNDNQSGVMLAFQPPDLKCVPLAEAI